MGAALEPEGQRGQVGGACYSCWPQLCQPGASSKAVGSRVQPPGPGTDWFSQLFGFSEQNHEVMRRCIRDGWLRAEIGSFGPTGAQAVRLVSDVNAHVYNAGYFETPSLGQLRRRVTRSNAPRGRLRVTNELGDVAMKHADRENRFATFQVASQFNCLEMVDPSVTPEAGVTKYAEDKTQGPACAVACGPGTVFRNYFARLLPTGDALPPDKPESWGSKVQVGQSRDLQVSTLSELSRELGNEPGGRFWTVQNGYMMSTEEALQGLNSTLARRASSEREVLLQALRVGVQSDLQVTSCDWGARFILDPGQLVTQVFGSACAVAYNRSTNPDSWAPLAKLILDASYESTLCAAALTAARHHGAGSSKRVFLTCLGGGVFGNRMEWIVAAMRRALQLFLEFDLDVRIVTHSGTIDPQLVQLANEFSGR